MMFVDNPFNDVAWEGDEYCLTCGEYYDKNGDCECSREKDADE